MLKNYGKLTVNKADDSFMLFILSPVELDRIPDGNIPVVKPSSVFQVVLTKHPWIS